MSASSSQKTIVISLGGSIIVPDTVDTVSVHAFVSFIKKQCEAGCRFFVITGGGKTAREYQQAVKEIGDGVSSDMLDWMGIYATKLNAEFLRLCFGDDSHDVVLSAPFDFGNVSRSVSIGAGHVPGNSSDMGAILAAEALGTKYVVNLSNIAQVFDKDPKQNLDAVPYDNISWQEYRRLIDQKWTPGMSSPFDPIASQKAEELGIEVAIIHGRDLTALEHYIKGESFIGTKIL